MHFALGKIEFDCFYSLLFVSLLNTKPVSDESQYPPALLHRVFNL